MRIQGPISPHGIARFKECPFKFYLHYTGRKPLETYWREAAEFGKAIHEIIAEYYRTLPVSITPQGAQGHLAAIFNKRWPVTLTHLRQRAERQLMNFLRFEKRRLTWRIDPRPVAVEKEYTKGQVHGIVDALFRAPNGELIVVDWKTGRSRARLTEDIVVQMNVYMYLTGARRAYALFLEFGEWYEVRPTIDVEKIVKELLSMPDYPPRPGPWCRTCEYQFACMASRYPHVLSWSPWSRTVLPGDTHGKV